MPPNKRKKNSRQKGSTTHGWGARNKHRGSGNRGGVGMAGTGKRAQSKKTSIWQGRYLGKHGFIKHGQKEKISAINICNIYQKIPTLISEEKIKKEGEIYIVDLAQLGYNKLLGKGNVKAKIKVVVRYASVSAVEKLKKGGCEITLTKEESK